MGNVMVMPTIPTSLSAAMEARQTARSNPICIAPASLTTSPPMVDGRKFEAKRPVKVNDMLSLKRMSIPPERNKMCHLHTIAMREIENKSATQSRSEVLIFLKALRISSHPFSLNKTTSRTTARIVPASCRIR